MFLAKSKQVSNITNHIDTREHFIREIADEGRGKFEKVILEETNSDTMTKIYQ